MVPKIVTKNQFEQSTNKHNYGNYINYVDREESKQNVEDVFQFDIYTHYMFDENKTNTMFNNDTNFMSERDIEETKKVFNESQKNNGIMWKDVISFDNQALIEDGLYDPETKEIDQQKFRQATRKMMNKFEDKEDLKDNLFWSASIHYNTDNIHVHVAAVENEVTRDRGKIKQSSIDNMKSTFANEIFDMSGERQKINGFIRDRIVKGIKEQTEPEYSPEFKKKFKKLHEELKDIPKNQWNYNNNSIKHLRPEIDKLTKIFIKEHDPVGYQDFKEYLKHQTKIYKNTYGENSNYNQYSNTKTEDLFQRSGNAVLKELREYDYDLKGKKQNSEELNPKTNQENKLKPDIKNKVEINKSTNKAITKTRYALKKEYESESNQRVYQKEQEKMMSENEIN